jgi:hypothetical protein
MSCRAAVRRTAPRRQQRRRATTERPPRTRLPTRRRTAVSWLATFRWVASVQVDQFTCSSCGPAIASESTFNLRRNWCAVRQHAGDVEGPPRPFGRRTRQIPQPAALWNSPTLKSVRMCGRVIRQDESQGFGTSGAGVTVKRQTDGSCAGYGNLMACGSVWACPRCAEVITAQRSEELANAVRAAPNIANGTSPSIAA